MHESREATLHIWRCDMPGCQAETETYSHDIVGSSYPSEWKSVPLSGKPFVENDEEEWLLLCPKHTSSAPLLKLVLQMLAKKAVLG